VYQKIENRREKKKKEEKTLDLLGNIDMLYSKAKLLTIGIKFIYD